MAGAVFIENLEKVDPDLADVFAHEAARLWYKLLLSGDSMRADHHKKRERGLRFSSHLWRDAESVTKQFTLVLEVGRMDSKIRIC